MAVFRRVVWLREWNAAVIFDEFFAGADNTHSYQQYFHFGPGKVRLEGSSVMWQGRQARAALHCLDEGECSLGWGAYSTDYNRLEEGDVLAVCRQGRGFSSFVTVLDLAAEEPLTASLLPVERTDGLPLSIPARAVELRRGESRAVVLERHGDMPTPVGLLAAGGFSGYGRTIFFSDTCPDGLVLDW